VGVINAFLEPKNESIALWTSLKSPKGEERKESEKGRDTARKHILVGTGWFAVQCG
jgi:hypothetical protein